MSIRAWLGTSLKKRVWELKYGLFGYPQFIAPKDVTEYLSANLLETSSILDVGCGRGTLFRTLRDRGFKGSYSGVEISANALKEAKSFADDQSNWIQSDIESFKPDQTWTAIVFVESLYYVSLRNLPHVFARFVQSLEKEGFILIRMHDVQKHQRYLSTIGNMYPAMKQVGDNLFFLPNER